MHKYFQWPLCDDAHSDSFFCGYSVEPLVFVGVMKRQSIGWTYECEDSLLTEPSSDIFHL